MTKLIIPLTWSSMMAWRPKEDSRKARSSALSRKRFSLSAAGQMIHAESDYALEETNGNATVTGAYRDFPSNTQFDNAIFISALHMQEGQYGGANFICYVLLDDPANRKAVEDNFNTSYDFKRFDGWLTPIRLTKFTDNYFLNEGNIYNSGSYSQLLLLIAIAILILLTGMINFTNFYIALTPGRYMAYSLAR